MGASARPATANPTNKRFEFMRSTPCVCVDVYRPVPHLELDELKIGADSTQIGPRSSVFFEALERSGAAVSSTRAAQPRRGAACTAARIAATPARMRSSLVAYERRK